MITGHFSLPKVITFSFMLLTSIEIAKKRNAPIVVIFNLVTKFLNAGWRHFVFMLKGLQEVDQTLSEVVRFCLKTNEPLRTTKFHSSYWKEMILYKLFQNLS